MKKIKKVFLTIIGLLFIACNSNKEISIAQDSEIFGFNHMLEGNMSTRMTEKLIYDNLFEIEKDKLGKKTLNLMLAESVTYLNDCTLQIKLKKGVRFHNGSELTSEDLIYSLDLLKNKGRNSYMLNSVIEVLQKDKYTVIITTEFADSTLLNTLAYELIVLNKKSDLTNSELPIGTGTFKFIEWNKESKYVVFEKNKKYYNKKKQAKVDKIIFTYLDTWQKRGIGLETGEYDIAINLFDTNFIENRDDINLFSRSQNTVKLLSFGHQNKILTNLKLRNAISLSLNKDRIISSISDGELERAIRLIPPNIDRYNEDEEKIIPYDKRKAKSLLKELRIKKPLNLSLAIIDSDPYNSIAENIKEDLYDIGINCEIIPMDMETFLNSIEQGSADLYLFSWTNVTGGPLYSILPVYQMFKVDNLIGSEDAKLTKKLFDDATTTLEPEKKWKLLSEVESLLIKESAIIPLYYDQIKIGYKQEIGGINYTSNGIMDFSSIYIKSN